MAQHGMTRHTGHEMDGVATIPDKLYFRIGEVATLCEVPTYVLRFWEGEFPQLKPNKGGTGQRLYRRRDVEMALRIKVLLYQEGYTIPGARQLLKTEQRQREPQLSLSIVEGDAPQTTDRRAIRGIQREMRELLNLLSATPVRTTIQSIRAVRPPRTALEASQASDELFK